MVQLSQPVNHLLTIGLVNDYCLLPGVQLNGSIVTNYPAAFNIYSINYGGQSGRTFFTDQVMQLAVDIINNSSDILPNIPVYIKRFSDCVKPNSQSIPAFASEAAGFASSIMVRDITEKSNRPVIGIIGSTYSTIAKGPAASLSVAQIPFCGAAIGAPSLSDKYKYPYFWRTMAASETGKHFARLFQTWGVTQVGIIYQRENELGTAFSNLFQETFQDVDINIPLNLGLKPALEESAVYYAYLSILNANVRYIILSGSNEFVGNLLVFLGRYGLVRAGYVYMSYNDPTASLDKHPELMDYMDGFVLIQGDAGDLINDRVQSVHNAFNARLNMDMRIEDFVGLFELPMAFDCVMIMLTGFHRLFQQHGPDLLTQGKLQSLMNHSLFEDVGYDGLMSTHMKLNKNGDLLMPFQLMIYDANEGMVAFGMTDIEASYVTYYENGQLTFNGGLTTPPWDGSYRVFELPVVSVIRTRLLALFCVGVVFCSLGLMGLILLRNNPVIKRASVAHNLLFTCACFISYLKLLFYSFNPSPSRCYNLWWPFPISSSIIMVSLICKNQVLSILADSPKRVKGAKSLVQKYFLVTVILFSVCIFLVAAWVITTPAKIKPVITNYGFYYRCAFGNSITSSWLERFVNLYLLFLSLALAATVRRMFIVRKFEMNESVPIILVGVALGLEVSIINTIKSSTDPYMNLSGGICVFLATSSIFSCLVGANIWKALASQRLNALKKIKRVSQNSLRLPGKIIDRGVRSVWNATPSTHLDPYARHPVTKPSKFLIYRAKMSALEIAPWCIGVVVIHAIGNRVWITLTNSEQTSCCKLVDETKVRVEYATVHVYTPGQIGELWFEFESTQLATVFASEIKTGVSAVIAANEVKQ